MSEELKGLVNAEDVAAAVKSLHGPQAALLHFKVYQATTSVQGFTSLMLRVTARVQVSPEETTSTSFIVKREPVLELQKEFSSHVNVREVAYFSQIAPILKQKIPDLPLVNCLFAEGSTVILEDLCESGYTTVGKTMRDVTTTALDISYFHLIARKVAEIHAASLDIDWMEIVPQYLKEDAFFEGGGGATFGVTMNLGAKAITTVMNHMYPDLDPKYSKWLSSPEYYKSLIKLTKYDPNRLNILGHGDCWLNNMMFKVDTESKEAVAMKLIDFQRFRFAPPSRDLLYFFYTCTSTKFREENEKTILRTYVDAFNAAVDETSDRLPFDTFMEEYEKSRWFGLGIGMVLRSYMLMDEIFPKETMTQKDMESIFFTDHSDLMVKLFDEDENCRMEISGMVDEIIHVLDRNGFV